MLSLVVAMNYTILWCIQYYYVTKLYYTLYFPVSACMLLNYTSSPFFPQPIQPMTYDYNLYGLYWFTSSCKIHLYILLVLYIHLYVMKLSFTAFGCIYIYIYIYQSNALAIYHLHIQLLSCRWIEG